jgi:adenylate cyclase
MTAEKVKRKLTAILSADVKGYSRLMGADEVGTIRILQTYRGVISDLIQKRGGRVVDSPGDNILAEFASVVDALESAVDIQRELKVRNGDRSESRRMEFRIGINLGDVVEEGERIYGDGVNIAARIEGLAEGGGICISGTAFDQIGKRLPLGYEYMGEQAVKNIEKPVRVYRVLMEPEQAGKVIGEKERKQTKWGWKAVAAVAVLIVVVGAFAWNFLWSAPKIEPASKEKMAFPLPDKPSIAVLPFVNMSGDPAKDFLSDGLTEDIITALSMNPNLFVIARNSSFTYKGKPIKVQQVAEELGVQYVLEGSVQWSGNRVRITAQLIDALKGHHLFSERYDRELKDILTLQDDITLKVVMGTGVGLGGRDTVFISKKETQNLDAFLKMRQASAYSTTFNKEKTALARKLVEEALDLDPNYPGAYAALSGITVLEVFLGVSKSPKESLDRAEELAKKALVLDESLAQAHFQLSLVYLFKKQFDKALEEAEHAVTLAPASAMACFQLGTALLHSERFEEAILQFKKSLRLDPARPYSQCLNNLGSAYRFLGRYDDAIATLKRMLHIYPDHLPGHLNAAATYTLAGREEEARAEVAEVMRIDPQFSLERYARTIPYRRALVDELVMAYRKAGLK